MLFDAYVGFSGGIDSTAAIFMLKSQGYNVTAVYLLMSDYAYNDDVKISIENLKERTDVEVIIYDVREQFRRDVVECFIHDSLNGETPSPCAVCNSEIKWKYLLEVADSRGGGYVATGHYCRIVEHDSRKYIAKGISEVKDQSYYMWSLSQNILSRALFPLGELTKEQVRQYMINKGWGGLVKKPESMGVCFFEGKKYSEWLLSQGIPINKGNVVLECGEVVGEHDGYPLYTLAQKRGFTLYESDRRLAVISINSERNEIVVGDAETLKSSEIRLHRCYFHSIDEVLGSEILELKVRGIGLNPVGYCRLQINNDSTITATLIDDTAWAVTKGQPVIFYIGDRLVGGGIVY